MRPSRSTSTSTILCAVALTFLACGDSGNGSSSSAGAELYASNCATCHGPEGAGNIGPNITGSESAGIGGWTEEDFATAVRTGIDDEDEELCSQMPRFTPAQLSDGDISEIYAWLHAQSDDTENPGTGCD